MKNREKMRKVHYCISGSIVTTIVVLLLIFNIGKPEYVAFASMGMVTYPFFELAVLDFSNQYRVLVGVIAAIVLPIVLIIGGVLIQLGPIWAALGFVIPVLNYIVLNMLPPRYRAMSWFIPIYYVTGMSIPMSIHLLLLFALCNCIGIVSVVLFYVIYYRLFAEYLTESKEAWYPSKKGIKLMIMEANPRVFRYGVIIYIASILAYAISIWLHNFIHSVVDVSHTYWASYFIFMILQFTPDIRYLYSRVWHRFIGTFSGLLIATLLIYLCPNLLGIRLIFLGVTALLLFVAYKPKTYFHFQITVNTYLLLMYVGLLGNGWDVAKYRFVETLIAVGVSLIAIVVIYPIIKRIIPVEKWEAKCQK